MKRYTHILLFFYVLLSIADCRLLLAQYEPQTILTSPPVPVGSGARAIGMGSAFIAVADDATAASWNPGGLTQLRRPEFSVVYAYSKRFEDYSSTHPEASGNHHTTMEDLNYLSVAYPFELCQRNMIVSLNYQMLYSFDRNLKFDYNTVANETKTSLNTEYDFRQRGSLKTLSPAYCIQVTPHLSLGATFNIWTDELFWGNGWSSTNNITKKQYYNHRPESKTYTSEYQRYSSFKGFNMNLGFLWKVNRVLTIGGVLKTPFRAGVKYKKTVTNKKIKLTDRSFSVEEDAPATKKEDLDFYMPLSFGAGMALRFSDKLTVSGDVTITDWSKFVLEDSQGRRYSPITGKPTKDSHVHATTQVRLGGEYLFILTNTVIPVRGGLFYDPEPAQNHANDFWGCSVGTGVSLGNLILDIAYQFRYGRNVNGTALDMPQRDADVSQHSFLASAIYHF
jgi:long-subunit fatty acid transport protein